VPSWESEGVDDHKGNEEQSQWFVLFFFSFPYPILIVDVTGLVGNLKTCSPSMFRFYSILKSWPEGQITQEEIDVASCKRPLTAEASAKFLGGLEAQSENIKNTFAKQQEQAAVSPHCVIYSVV
jgi:hypothetical protein